MPTDPYRGLRALRRSYQVTNMAKSKEQTLIDDGGIRLRCSEPSKLKCPECGDTSHSAEAWAGNGETCPMGCGASPQLVCARCEKGLDAPPLGEHPCHSRDVYRESGQVVFAEEMIPVTEARERRESAAREDAERERVAWELAERERVEWERTERVQAERAERERVAREREALAARERAGRERSERDRVEREAQAARAQAERERAARTEGAKPSGTLWKIIVGVVIGAGLVFMFTGKDSDKSQSVIAKKPAETTATHPQQTVETNKLQKTQNQSLPSPEPAPSKVEKKEAELKATLRKIIFTAKKDLVFRKIDESFLAALRKEGRSRSSNVLDEVAAGFNYLMADADLDGDGVPEIIIRATNCIPDGCATYVVKNVAGEKYKHISYHHFTGTIGVTNEKICGFNALYDTSKTTSGIIKAEPMNELKNLSSIQCSPGDANFRSDMARTQSPTPVAAQAPSESTDIVRTALAVYQLADLLPHLDAIVVASNLGKEDAISREIDAIQKLSRPARGDRKTARAANVAGLTAMQQSAYGDAVTSFADGVKADPADQEIVDNLASALLKNRRLADAAKAALASLMLNPMRSSAWANLAAIIAENGKQEDVAISSYHLAYRFSRNQEKTREYLERVKQEDGNPKIREAASKALATLPVSATPMNNAAQSQVSDFDKAFSEHVARIKREGAAQSRGQSKQ